MKIMEIIKTLTKESKEIYCKVRRIRKRISREAFIKKQFSVYFRDVKISGNKWNHLRYGFMCVYCKHPYLTSERICAVFKKRNVAVDEEWIMDWISDILNAYLEDVHHLGLGAKPFPTGDGGWTFVISEKGV